MTNRTFQFESPRVALIFANIKTVREIRSVIDDEGKKEIERFLKYLQNNIKDFVPELQSWKDSEIGKTGVYISPDAHWDVVDDDYIAIGIDFYYGKDPSSKYDPWVGLYVPENWEQKKIFKEKLIATLQKGFIGDWEFGNEYPLWAYVKYEDYSDGESFDIKKFIDDIVRLVGKLVKMRDTIDNTIEQVKGKQK